MGEADADRNSAREPEEAGASGAVVPPPPPTGRGRTCLEFLWRLGAFGLVFLASLAAGLFTSFIWESSQLEGRVLRGVRFGQSDLAGLDLAQLRARLDGSDREARRRTIALTLRDARLERSAAELGLGLDVARMTQAALGTGREGGLLRRFGSWLDRLTSTVQVAPVVSLDRVRLEAQLEPWVKGLLPAPRSPEIRFGEPPEADFGQAGEEVDFERLLPVLRARFLEPVPRQLGVPSIRRLPAIPREQVLEQLHVARSLSAQPVRLLHEGEVIATLRKRQLLSVLESRLTAEPRLLVEIAPQKLRRELEDMLPQVEIPAKNASFEVDARGSVRIVESEPGIALDDAALASALLGVAGSSSREVSLPLVSRQPNLSTEKARNLGVKGLVSSFLTRHPCCQPRVHNIHHAAAILDGVVVLPGETFSLNALLGPRTARAGYESAPTIVHGDMQETEGGGVSQLATTLFNAVLDAGYQIVQRQPHSFYFPRYPEGHEATVSFPEPDLRFRNDTGAGLVIKTHAAPTFIKVMLFGDSEGRRVTRHRSTRYDIKVPPIEYEADERLAPDEQKRASAGQLGWTVLVSRKIRFADGSVSEQKREVVYRPRPEVLRVHPCMIPEDAKGFTGQECPEILAAEPEDFSDEPREFVDRLHGADAEASFDEGG